MKKTTITSDELADKLVEMKEKGEITEREAIDFYNKIIVKSYFEERKRNNIKTWKKIKKDWEKNPLV